jgi:hypothetical protein
MRQAGLDPEEDADRVAKSSYLPRKPGFNAVYVKYLDIEKPGRVPQRPPRAGVPPASKASLHDPDGRLKLADKRVVLRRCTRDSRNP